MKLSQGTRRDEGGSRKSFSPVSLRSLLKTPLPGSVGSTPVYFDSLLAVERGALALAVDHSIHIDPRATRFPDSRRREVLAHEAVHAAQQMGAGAPDRREGLEREAAMLSSRWLASQPTPPLLIASPALPLHYEIGTDAAAQSEAIVRVDALLRDRFNLSGPGLTVGSVRFQRPVAFRRGFSSDSTRDFLIGRFQNPFESRILNHILQYYNLGDDPVEIERFVQRQIRRGEFLYVRDEDRTLFEDGQSWGLYSSRPNPYILHLEGTRRAFYGSVTGRPEGDNPTNLDVHVHRWVDVRDVTTRIAPQALRAELVSGYTTMETSRAERRIRLRNPAYHDTLIHEACHFYSHPAFETYARSAGNLPFPYSEGPPLSQVLLEGFPEFFTREIMRENASEFGPLGSEAYPREVENARLIIGNAGQPTSESAYFQGGSGEIQAVRTGVAFVGDHPELAALIAQDQAVREMEAAMGDVTTAPLPTDERGFRRSP